MNKGTRPKTVLKYEKVKKLVTEGVYLVDALRRYQMSSRTFFKMKREEQARAEAQTPEAV
jgi:hypothetical protein